MRSKAAAMEKKAQVSTCPQVKGNWMVMRAGLLEKAHKAEMVQASVAFRLGR